MNEIKDGLREKFLKDIEYTSLNYSNMYDRLQMRNNWSKFFVVYYSVIAVINAILPKVFVIPDIYCTLLDFTSIVVSIIMLVASLSVSLANYSERSLKVMQGLDALKRLKKTLVYSNEDLEKEDYKKYSEFLTEYHGIVDNVELRTDYDFYRTCREKGEVRDRFSWMRRVSLEVKHLGEVLLYLILFAAPLIFYVFVYLGASRTV